MPTRNEIDDPEAGAGHDRHTAERERLGMVLHGAGLHRITSMARSICRFMVELVLIAAAAVVGALIGAYYDSGFGDSSSIGMAGAMANLASSVGLGMFLLRSFRAGSRVFGGIVIRVPVMLLCVGAEISGLACMCDDVSQAVYLPRVTFEQGGLPH